MRRPDTTEPTDALIRAATPGNLQRCPAALTADATQVVADGRELLTSTAGRGYFIRDVVQTWATPGDSRDFTYTDLTTNAFADYVMASFTDRITSNQYTYSMVNAEVDATGFPRDFHTIGSVVDSFVQNVAIGSVSTADSSNPNDHYRRMKASAYNNTSRTPWNNLVSAYDGTLVEYDMDVTLGSTYSLADSVNPTAVVWAVPAAGLTADTTAGALTGFRASTVNLEGKPLTNLTVNTRNSTDTTNTRNLSNPLANTTLADATPAFDGCTLGGTITVNVTAGTNPIYLNLTGSSRVAGADVNDRITVNRSSTASGMRPVQVIGAPADTIFGNGVTVFVEVVQPTRLQIDLTPLDVGDAYAIYAGTSTVPILSSTRVGTQTRVEYTNQLGDATGNVFTGRGVRANLTSETYTIAYVSGNKRATFKGITPTANTSVINVLTHTLTPTEFGIAFEVPAASLGDRTCIVQATDASNTRTEFVVAGNPPSSRASEEQSSLLIANARNSVNYLNSMRRRIAALTLAIPTNWCCADL